MKAARQALRSQDARDYAECELVHAEATIHELRHWGAHAHREKDAALEAVRLVTAANLAAQSSGQPIGMQAGLHHHEAGVI